MAFGSGVEPLTVSGLCELGAEPSPGRRGWSAISCLSFSSPLGHRGRPTSFDVGVFFLLVQRDLRSKAIAKVGRGVYGFVHFVDLGWTSPLAW